jgi:hypothetical protein
MEKRFRRVQRWLERCIEACKKEKWANAVADVECARAELETAREELWVTLSAREGSREKTGIKYMLPLSARSAVLAILIVMSAAIPLSTGTGSTSARRAEEAVTLEWVTADEKKMLSELRRSLSDMNMARVVEEQVFSVVENKIDSGRDVAEAETSKPHGAPTTEGKGPYVPGQGTPAQLEVAIEEILTLYEIGQRALKAETLNIGNTETQPK